MTSSLFFRCRKDKGAGGKVRNDNIQEGKARICRGSCRSRRVQAAATPFAPGTFFFFFCPTDGWNGKNVTWS